MYQPKTGAPCWCRPGIQRDNCPDCEGTGMKVDFAAIRARCPECSIPTVPDHEDLSSDEMTCDRCYEVIT